MSSEPQRVPRSEDIPSVDIRPGVGMLALFPHMNYRAWYALAELVDNALQSYLDNKDRLRQSDGPHYRLRVEISLSSGTSDCIIRVADNAAGIAATDYGRAFTTADPPPSREALSQFGIGMKSASCWFARRFTVRSKALDEHVVRTLSFDVPRIAERGIEKLSPKSTLGRPAEHFTEITLRDLYQVPVGRAVGKVKDHLRSMYRIFLRREELILVFNGEELQPDEPEVLEAPPASDPKGAVKIWRKDVDFRFGTKGRATGFLAIRKTASTAKAGLALFRNDRLIQGSDEDAYRPVEIFGRSNSYRYQRVFGELRLQGVDVSHTKDVFQWGDYEPEFLDKLKLAADAQPLPLLRQAEEYRARQATKDLIDAADRAAADTLAVVAQMGDTVSEEATAPVSERPIPRALGAGPTASRRDVDLEVDGEDWIVTLDLSTDPAVGEWLALFDTDAGPAGSRSSTHKRRLGIRLALLHPFMLQFGGNSTEELEALLRVAVGLAIAETLARDAGIKMAQEVRLKLNRLLAAELAKPKRLL